MRIISLETGNLKLDGGAMFGVVPKSIWNKIYPADENNLVNISMRALYIEDDKRKILIDTGMGNKQDARFLSHYYLNGNDTLDQSLIKNGISKSSITDVILSHLHFDHCGAAVELNVNTNQLSPAFVNAKYHVSKLHWSTAMAPNRREKASFLPENFKPLLETESLNLFDDGFWLTKNIQLRLFNGHTAGMALTFIKTDQFMLVHVADLMPIMANVPIAYICAYDMQPIISLEEKEQFLKEAYEKSYVLFFEHDIYNECCKIEKGDKDYKVGPVSRLFNWMNYS